MSDDKREEWEKAIAAYRQGLNRTAAHDRIEPRRGANLN